MKKIIVILIFASCILNISAQNSLSELPNFERYKIPKEEILSMPAQHNRVVFIGNAITDACP